MFETVETNRIYLLRERLFSAAACARMRGLAHLHPDDVAENLFVEFRDEATRFFAQRSIAGHGNGTWDKSVTSSQVACVNCWFPFIDHPTNLTKVLGDVFGDVDEALPIIGESPLDDGTFPFLTFEWIDRSNRLGERGRLVRGKWVTNVDVLFRYRTTKGRVRLVLTEWKYRESGGPGSIRVSDNGTDRLTTYLPHFAIQNCQIILPKPLQPDDLMFHPIDQLMRLQLLATIFQRDRDMEADDVVVLHIAPRANTALLATLHSPNIAQHFEFSADVGVHEAWESLTAPGAFRHFATEDLVPILARHAPTPAFADYISLRYGGIADPNNGAV